jgi:hypothetical protein
MIRINLGAYSFYKQLWLFTFFKINNSIRNGFLDNRALYTFMINYTESLIKEDFTNDYGSAYK